jgi:transglutaminase-like putative cysteine protease
MPTQRDDLQVFLNATPTLQSDHPAVLDYVGRHVNTDTPSREAAVKLYYAIRDDIRYDPYRVDLSVDGLSASTTLANEYGWCVPKAALLATCCRSVGIPARLGYADVRNHLSTERMRDNMQTEVFYWHGYTSIHLDGRWVKATPAFNLSLCEKFGLQPLEFDGREDSLFHEFDSEGKRHMEYLKDRGEFADVPLDEMAVTLRKEYPGFFDAADAGAEWAGDFDRDVEEETAQG